MCNICGKSFGRVSILKKHKITTHHKASNSKYSCHHCGKMFTRKDMYQRHQVTHSNYRPWSCPYCPLRFKTKQTCSKHIKIHSKSNYDVISRSDVIGPMTQLLNQSTNQMPPMHIPGSSLPQPFEPEAHTIIDPYEFNPIPTDSIGFNQDPPLQFIFDYEPRNPSSQYTTNVPTIFDVPPSTPAPMYEKPPPSNEMIANPIDQITSPNHIIPEIIENQGLPRISDAALLIQHDSDNVSNLNVLEKNDINKKYATASGKSKKSKEKAIESKGRSKTSKASKPRQQMKSRDKNEGMNAGKMNVWMGCQSPVYNFISYAYCMSIIWG